MKSYFHLNDLPGFGRLAFDGIHELTNLVEAVHRKIAGIPADKPTGGIPGLVYNCIHGVTDFVKYISVSLAPLIPELEAQGSIQEREALIAALNGVVGDYLLATNNSLAISMGLRHDGQSIELNEQSLGTAYPKPSRKVLVLVHGLCMNDLQWTQQEHDYGAALARDLGFTPVYLHYNSGLHISTNGHSFSEQLEGLVKGWPVPLEELVILSHSMGGLVTRSACRSASDDGQAWLAALRKLFFLGTPHHGSALERGGNWIQAVLGANAYTAPFARLGKIRSAGITDMRYGSLLDEDWKSRDRFTFAHDQRQPVPLPEGVESYTIGAVMGSKASGRMNTLIGDGLVPLRSALGYHADPRLALAIPESHQWVGSQMNHFDLIRKEEVYERIKQWLVE